MSGLSQSSLSTVSGGQMIDFEMAELRRLPFQDNLYLWVKGQLPAKGLNARLAPRIYHDRPDYWVIEVAAFVDMAEQTDTDLPRDEASVSLNFERSVPLAGITGTRGVAVIGANRSERIDIDGEAF
jgi:hypothetical protein